jgi:hypothetical protein
MNAAMLLDASDPAAGFVAVGFAPVVGLAAVGLARGGLAVVRVAVVFVGLAAGASSVDSVFVCVLVTPAIMSASIV